MIKKIIKKDIKNILNPIILLVFIVIIIVPSLYSLVNIVAFWDPYNNIDQLNVGIVNEDNGYIGKELVNSLEKTKDLNFVSTNYENGYKNLNRGSYYGLMIIPKNFTKSIESINTSNPYHGDIQFLTNGKTNMVANKIMTSGGIEIQKEINDKIVSTIAGITFGEGKNISDLSMPKINSYESEMNTINNYLSKSYTLSKLVYKDAKKVIIYVNKTNHSEKLLKTLTNDLNKLNNKINNFNNQRILFEDDVNYFNENYYPLLVKISKYNTLSVENYFNSPVIINNTDIHPLKSYGDGIAQFYIPLSLFIGNLIPLAMFSPRVKGLKVKPFQEYLGKLALFGLISVLQSTVLTIGLVIINVQYFNPFMLIISNIFIGLCFTIFIYSLVSSLGNSGKFITILMLVFQIGGSGGMYPIQLLPKFFQIIHFILPISYGVNIIRENVAAPLVDVLISNALILLIFPIFGVIFTLIIKPFLQKKINDVENILEKSELF
ncbi:YhgE/Pip domain-containing protein [Methanobrevibacter curvatus]|uniref:ABC-2 family transporter protein n=1 Tax=Methanobrevibacter curvatus TaxID=49547 RepID=A0A162FA41_9EURY|nr:YhgE/Pip family protein [Methanobrevibacter curvatus]KZX10115.1 ABC-2 family transporter protein [Methanobrevibacter curvatus]